MRPHDDFYPGLLLGVIIGMAVCFGIMVCVF